MHEFDPMGSDSPLICYLVTRISLHQTDSPYVAWIVAVCVLDAGSVVLDAANVVPPTSKVPFHVILRGGTEGERTHLSLKNEFRLVLPAYGTEAESPTQTDGLGLVIQPEGEPRIDATLFGEPSAKNPVIQPEKTSSK